MRKILHFRVAVQLAQKQPQPDCERALVGSALLQLKRNGALSGVQG
jgi:hypothetical protein